MLKCDAVFEGGGVRGIGFVGAVMALEDKGYSFENSVGTSAGAIVAALLAVGYSSEEIYRELKGLNYTKFRDAGRFERLGGVAKVIRLGRAFGVYKTGYFDKWLKGLLERKGKRVFGDIRTKHGSVKYKFQAIASDITDKKMLVLPGDLAEFGLNPDSFPIATAVRMSISIPFFYEPYVLCDVTGRKHLIADGGILSNYPMWVLDDGSSKPQRPAFGLRFVDQSTAHYQPAELKNIADYSKAVVGTLMKAHDNRHISESKGDRQRTILIPTTVNTESGQKNIDATYFDITADESRLLFDNGKISAEEFLCGWDFQKWVSDYRYTEAQTCLKKR